MVSQPHYLVLGTKTNDTFLHRQILHSPNGDCRELHWGRNNCLYLSSGKVNRSISGNICRACPLKMKFAQALLLKLSACLTPFCTPLSWWLIPHSSAETAASSFWKTRVTGINANSWNQEKQNSRQQLKVESCLLASNFVTSFEAFCIPLGVIT